MRVAACDGGESVLDPRGPDRTGERSSDLLHQVRPEDGSGFPVLHELWRAGCSDCSSLRPAGVQPPAAPSWQPAPASPPQAFAPVKKRSGLALLFIILGVLALLAVIGIGGVVYVGYMVKEKVTSVAQSVAHPAPVPGENKASSPGTNNNDDGNKDVSAILGNLGNMLGAETMTAIQWKAFRRKIR